MKYLFIACLSFWCAVPAGAAVEVFDASDLFDNGGMLSGTVSIDTAKGSVTAADLFLSGTANPFEASRIEFAGKQQGPFVDDYFVQVAHDATVNSYFNILIKSNLVGYRGGDIYGDEKPAPGGLKSGYLQSGQSEVLLANGKLTLPGSSAPEPSSWAMLVLGLGAAGLASRRARAATRAARQSQRSIYRSRTAGRR